MRHPHCYQRLLTLWQNKRNTPFQWGQHDCLTLALDAIEAVTGSPLTPSPLPLPYRSGKGARRLQQRQSLLERVEQALEQFEILTNHASLQSGDIAVLAVSPTGKNAQTMFAPHEEEHLEEGQFEEQSWIALGVVDLSASGFVLPRKPCGIARIRKRQLAMIKAWQIA